MAKRKKVYNQEKDNALLAKFFFHKVIVDGVDMLREKYKVPKGGLPVNLGSKDYVEWEKKNDLDALLRILVPY